MVWPTLYRYMLTSHWNQHLFHSFEDFGCLSVMSYDALCVDSMIQWHMLMVFAAVSTTVFCSQQGVSTQSLTECARRYGHTLILSFTWIITMFLLLFVTHEILDFVHFQILQKYVYLIINMVDMYLASFSLLGSFCLVLYCVGSILWMCGS